jgi:hypothetical protein
VKNGMLCSASFVMNLFKAAILLVTLASRFLSYFAEVASEG